MAYSSDDTPTKPFRYNPPAPAQPLRFGGSLPWNQSGTPGYSQRQGYAGPRDAFGRLLGSIGNAINQGGQWANQAARTFGFNFGTNAQAAAENFRERMAPYTNFYTNMTPEQRMAVITYGPKAAAAWASRGGGSPSFNLTNTWSGAPALPNPRNPAPDPRNNPDYWRSAPASTTEFPMNWQAQKTYAERQEEQGTEYLTRPIAPQPTATPTTTPPTGGGGYGWGGWGGGGGGGYSAPLKEYYNAMVNWSINQPTRGG